MYRNIVDQQKELIMNGTQKLLVHTGTDNEWGTEASGSYRN
jgi:hypothetical protein